MTRHVDALVAGLGEVGRPLLQMLDDRWDAAGLDLEVAPKVDTTSFLHICYPFQVPDFVGTTKGYVEQFKAEIVIVHSTLAPGTTDRVQRAVASPVFYSPVRGKHHVMQQELRRYKKFIAGPTSHIDEAVAHLEAVGMTTELMGSATALETAKLLETTYFGVLIAWAQETERFARAAGSDYDTVRRFFDEVSFLPANYFPGYIGGHCVMPNLELLVTLRPSEVVDWVRRSNEAFRGESSTDD